MMKRKPSTSSCQKFTFTQQGHIAMQSCLRSRNLAAGNKQPGGRAILMSHAAGCMLLIPLGVIDICRSASR